MRTAGTYPDFQHVENGNRIFGLHELVAFEKMVILNQSYDKNGICKEAVVEKFY